MLFTTMILAPTPTEHSPRRLLIVDDHPDLASTLARTIAQVCPGVEVVSSQGGREALELVGNLPLDVLITDLMMPEMSGIDLIEKLRAQPIGAPDFVIMITAYDTAISQERADELHINEIVVKPFPPGLLIQIVRGALDRMAQKKVSKPIEAVESDAAA